MVDADGRSLLAGHHRSVRGHCVVVPLEDRVTGPPVAGTWCLIRKAGNPTVESEPVGRWGGIDTEDVAEAINVSKRTKCKSPDVGNLGNHTSSDSHGSL